MATAETFSVYRDDPEWDEFSFQEKNQLRHEWVRRRAISAGKTRNPDYIKTLMNDAFADAPWGLSEKEQAKAGLLPESLFRARHPEWTAAGETAMRMSQIPQQIVASLLSGLGEKGTVKEAFTKPLVKFGGFLSGEEPTELPGGMATQILTDPLMYTGLTAPYHAYRAAKAAIPGVKMIPTLGKAATELMTKRALRGTPTLMGELGQVIPKTFAEFSPFQKEVYNKTLQAGRRFFSPDELKQVGATLANLPEREAAVALSRLNKMKNANEARSLLAWAQSPQWRRQARWWKSKPPTGTTAATPEAAPVAGAATPVEELTQIGPRDYLKRLMEEPSLE